MTSSSSLSKQHGSTRGIISSADASPSAECQDLVLGIPARSAPSTRQHTSRALFDLKRNLTCHFLSVDRTVVSIPPSSKICWPSERINHTNMKSKKLQTQSWKHGGRLRISLK